MEYVFDRAPLLLAFTGALLFLMLVVGLGYSALRLGDALYVLLLAGTTATVIFVVDYRRQRHFRHAVTRELEYPPESVTGLTSVVGATTREQRALNRLLEGRHLRYTEELRAFRDRSATHRVFFDQWVHQMKTPLSVLELTVQEALSDSDAHSRDLWESVAEEVDAISEGMELMLSVARLDGFELDVRPTKVDLGAAARDAVNGLKRSWIRSGVFPRVTAPHEPLLVETDPKWLATILRQVLTNALKYSVAGRRVDRVDGDRRGTAPDVAVEVTAVGEGAKLTVRDRGIGIPEEDVPRVFERFFTGHNGRTGRASTGMGLYLVGEIVRHLGHRVELTSAPGQGTTVSLEFSSRGVHRLGSGSTAEVSVRPSGATSEVTGTSPSADGV